MQYSCNNKGMVTQGELMLIHKFRFFYMYQSGENTWYNYIFLALVYHTHIFMCVCVCVSVCVCVCVCVHLCECVCHLYEICVGHFCV